MNEGKLQKLLLLFLFLTGYLAIVPCTHAADLYWVNTLPATDWSTPENWGGAEPTAADNAYIAGTVIVQVTQPGETCNTLYLSNTLEMTNGSLSETNAVIGWDDLGNFAQSGGTHTISGELSLGTYANGYYNLSGSGTLSAASETIGNNYSSVFYQSGGTNSTIKLLIGASGLYSNSGGALNISGGLKNFGTINFLSNAGTINAVSSILDFSSGSLTNTENASFSADSHSLVLVRAGQGAAFASSFATYTNDGILHEAGSDLNIDASRTIYGTGGIFDHVNCDGTLAATAGFGIILNRGLTMTSGAVVDLGTGLLYVKDVVSGMSGGSLTSTIQVIGRLGTGSFTQSAGTNTPGLLDIQSTGTYTLSGGTLNISGGIANAGVFDLAASASTISAPTGILDFSKGLPINAQNASIDIGANSLTILPVGASATFPAMFANYSNQGIVHEAGSAFTIDAGRTIFGAGTIADHVNVNGTLAAVAGQRLYITRGLTIVEGGSVNLGMGELHIKDASSQSGGSIVCQTEFHDSTSSGSFTQTGGTHSITESLTLGWAGGFGTYNLSGSGSLSTPTEFIDLNSTFNQSGGTNTITASGLIYRQGGTYNLTGGTLVTHYINNPYSAGFNFGGGTLQINAPDNIPANMALTGIGGDATIDTSGYASTMSGTLSGIGGLKKTGNGTLTLSASNTYSGDTKIYAGQIVLGSVNALQNSTLDYNNYGGSLDYGEQTAAYFGGLKGNQDLSLLNSQSKSVTLWIGANNQSTTYSGTITGTGAIMKQGTGLLTLAGANNFTGTMNVIAGNLRINSPANIAASGSPITLNVYGNAMLTIPVGGTGEWTVADLQSILVKNPFWSNSILGLDTTNAPGGNFTFDNPINRNVTLVKLGSNSLTLSSASNLLGMVKINGGALVLGHPLALQSSLLDYGNYGGSLSFGTLTAATLGGLKGTQDLVLENANAEPVALTIGSSGTPCTYSGVLSGSGSFTRILGGTLTLSGANTFTGDTILKGPGVTLANSNALQNSTLDYNSYGGNLIFGSLTSATLGGLKGNQNLSLGSTSGALALTIGGNNQSTTYSGIFLGPGSLIKTGTGTLTLSAANTFIGETKIRGGYLTLAHQAALQNSTLDYNSYGGTLSFGSLTAAFLGGLKGSQNLSLTNENGDPVTLTVRNGNTASTYSGVFSGAGSLIKNIGQSFTLAGANTFTGDTKITGSSLILANINALQNSTLDYNSYGGTLSFGTLTSATLGGLKGNQNLSLINSSNTPVTLTIGGNGQSLTYSGSLSGTGSLIKVGAGTLTLTGANNYSGGTTINAGVLLATSPGSLANYSTPGRVTVNNGGTLTINAGPWLSTDIQTLLNRATFSNGSTLFINTDSSSLTYDYGIGGNLRLVKSGLGTLALTGTTSYTGGTVIDSGLLMAFRWALPGYDTQGKVVVNGGTLGLPIASKNGWGDSDVGTLVSHTTFNAGSTLQLDISNAVADVALVSDLGGNFNLKKVGWRTLTLTGALTYTGSTTIDSGTLKIITPTTMQPVVALHDIVGAGDLVVGDGLHDTVLSATSIQVNSLTIGASPGVMQAVPEPSAILLLLAAIAAFCCSAKKHKRC